MSVPRADPHPASTGGFCSASRRHANRWRPRWKSRSTCLPGKADGLLNEESGPNGRPLITAFHALPSPGLLLAVSLDRGAASAEWRNKLAVDGGLLAAEILVLASATTIILQLLRARHAATVRLASRERQLLLAESIAHMGAVTFDIATATVRPSPQIAAIFGWPDPVEEIPLQAFLAAVHEADRQPLRKRSRAGPKATGRIARNFASRARMAACASSGLKGFGTMARAPPRLASSPSARM
jgi:hypothetical protein